MVLSRQCMRHIAHSLGSLQRCQMRILCTQWLQSHWMHAPAGKLHNIGHAHEVSSSHHYRPSRFLLGNQHTQSGQRYLHIFQQDKLNKLNRLSHSSLQNLSCSQQRAVWHSKPKVFSLHGLVRKSRGKPGKTGKPWETRRYP